MNQYTQSHERAVKLEAKFMRMRAEIERLRAALQEINDLCKREPANPFLADNMDRVATAALRLGALEQEPPK